MNATQVVQTQRNWTVIDWPNLSITNRIQLWYFPVRMVFFYRTNIEITNSGGIWFYGVLAGGQGICCVRNY